MDARLQRRVQRYGWDLAAAHYEALWQAQLAPAQQALLAAAALRPGERVLDVACGTGLVTLQAAAVAAEAPGGEVVGVDIAEAMLEAARAQALRRGLAAAARFARMDAERLGLPDASFDAVLCALGLMYLPDPPQALREMRRVLRPGGRAVLAVWGERARCGWASVFPIVDAEVRSDVCPLFFGLGTGNALARACIQAGLRVTAATRLATTLRYADADTACSAAFAGGPVALAWSRFDAATRERVCRHYVASLAQWRCGAGFEVPGEFVVVAAERAGAGDG
jgi:ubiquinone/menaquinone biosynthesis C-methylase UbiE